MCVQPTSLEDLGGGERGKEESGLGTVKPEKASLTEGTWLMWAWSRAEADSEQWLKTGLRGFLDLETEKDISSGLLKSQLG